MHQCLDLAYEALHAPRLGKRTKVRSFLLEEERGGKGSGVKEPCLTNVLVEAVTSLPTPTKG